MSITVSPSAANFDLRNQTPVQVTLTNGVGPYSASSGNTNVATVAQATSPNIYPNADTLSGSTQFNNGTGVTQSVGINGPGGATSFDIVKSTTGAVNMFWGHAISVTPGQTYLFSAWLKPASIGSFLTIKDINDFTTFGGTIQQTTVPANGAAQRYSVGPWTCPTNLCPLSDSLTNWSLASGATRNASGGPGGQASIDVVGNGSATSANGVSPNIAVTPGQWYTYSIAVKAASFTGGPPSVRIYDNANAQYVGTATVSANGSWIRYSVSWQAAVNATTIALIVALNSATVPNGTTISFTNPMLEPQSSASGYYISSENPQVNFVLEQNGTFTDTNTFSYSQPMVRTDGVSTPYVSPSGVWTITPKNGGRSIVTFTDSTTPTAQTQTLNATVYPLPKPKFPDALKVGSVNKKVLAFIGLDDITSGVYTRSILPMGTFLLSDTTGKTQIGEVSQSARGYDITREFDFDVFGALPPPLFGIQNDIRYNSNYALKNPSNDLKTYVCDAKRFMQAKTDNPFLASAFQAVFNGSTPPANGVNVYVGTVNSPATTPVSPSTYTWDPVNGIVTFTAVQASNAVVSIDGVPQAMAPETMLTHLFNDYGGYSPSYFKFNTSNILLPAYVGGQGKTVWGIAQDIASATAPRGVAWRIRLDEFGYINFYEDKYATTPKETLIDERDFLQLQYTQTDNQLANVVRAEVEANNQQSIVSISYDIDSISENGERKTDDISTQSFLSLRGLPPLQVKSLLDTYTAVQLHDSAQPITELTVTLLANPARQVGDKVTVIERQNGLSGPYIIKGLTDTIDTGTWLQEARLRQVKLFANQNMGLPSAVTNVPAPGSTSDVSQNKNAGVTGRTGIIKTVTIGGTTAIQNGGIVYDSTGTPVLPVISGQNWTFSFTIDSTQAYDTTVYQFLYFESPNSLSSTDIMAIRLSNWLTNDGTVIPAATISGGYTQTSTHSTGTSLGSGENAYLYSNLVYPAYATTLPPGYQQQMTSLNWLASTGLSGSVGVGTGPSYTGSYAYWPQAKFTYGWYVCLAMNAAGATSLMRCPIVLSS